MQQIKLIKIYLKEKYEFRYSLINNELEYRDKPKPFKEIDYSKYSKDLKVKKVYIFPEIQVRYKPTKLGVQARPMPDEFKEIPFADLFCELLEKGYKVNEQLLTMILKSSFVPKYDSFRLYFDDLPKWDFKTDYIEELSRYVKVQFRDKSRWENQFKKYLVRCVACALDAGYFNKQCLTIIGKQNDGKSTFCEFLAPPKLAEYLQRGLNGDGKDQQITLTTNFIINLDELATFGKFELNSLKSMFSQAYVKTRPPFEKKAIRVQRRANFVASTNEKDFLTDPTGSVRWLCFEIDKIDFDYTKKVDINRIWAQAYALYKKHGVQRYEMTRDEIKENEAANRLFTNASMEEELLAKYFKPASKNDAGAIFFTATTFITALQERERTIRLKKTPMGKAAIALGFERTKSKGLYGYWATVRPTDFVQLEEEEKRANDRQLPLTDFEKEIVPPF